MSKHYAISDTHFLHSNIIKYCNRPFENSNKMDVAIINNINSIVNEDDVLWHLGDVAYGKNAKPLSVLFLLNQIKCKTINLIVGNHDQVIFKSQELKSRFNLILNYYLGDIENHPFLLVHRPPCDEHPNWEKTLIERELKLNPERIWLHGHVHDKMPGPRNMCVEILQYKPVLISDIINRIKKIESSNFDQ